jgi:hypothetical protein
MVEGVFHTYIVQLAGLTNGEELSPIVWRGCLLCYEIQPSFNLHERRLTK